MLQNPVNEILLAKGRNTLEIQVTGKILEIRQFSFLEVGYFHFFGCRMCSRNFRNGRSDSANGINTSLYRSSARLYLGIFLKPRRLHPSKWGKIGDIITAYQERRLKSGQGADGRDCYVLRWQRIAVASPLRII